MMVAVMYFAVATATVTPLARLNGIGGITWLGIALFGVISTPLSWAVLSLLVVPRGLLREWLVFAFLAFACSIVLIVAGVLCVVLLVLNLGPMISGGNRVGTGVLFMSFVVAVGMMLAIRFLIPRFIPGQCPCCERRGLLRDPGALVVAAPYGGSFEKILRCIRCDRLFLRLGAGWGLTETQPSSPPIVPAAPVQRSHAQADGAGLSPT